MGRIAHHVLIVIGFDRERANRAYRKAVELFPGQVTPILESPVNNYHSFFVGPDGSKEGWEPSDHGDAQRARFADWLADQLDLWVRVAEVCLGEEGPKYNDWSLQKLQVGNTEE